MTERAQRPITDDCVLHQVPSDGSVLVIPFLIDAGNASTKDAENYELSLSKMPTFSIFAADTAVCFYMDKSSRIIVSKERLIGDVTKMLSASFEYDEVELKSSVRSNEITISGYIVIHNKTLSRCYIEYNNTTLVCETPNDPVVREILLDLVHAIKVRKISVN